jgi:hypothetical protein
LIGDLVVMIGTWRCAEPDDLFHYRFHYRPPARRGPIR